MLMLHTDSALATEEDLAHLPVPVSLGETHQPVPHAVLVSAMRATVLAQGYTIARQELGLGRRGKRLFGVMDLEPPANKVRRGDRGLSIGFRNSTDETLAIRVVAGARVFVCDNLCLSGDMIALKRRNIKSLDLASALAAGFKRYVAHAHALDLQITDLQEASLSDHGARAKLYALFADKTLPMRLFRPVYQNYFEPSESMTDCQPRTWWGLHNACTRALKLVSRQRAFPMNVALGYAFGLTQRDDA